MTYGFTSGRFFALATAAILSAACADATAPASSGAAGAPTSGPSRLIAPGEAMSTIADTVDARGNHTMVVEYAAGTVQGTGDQPGYSVGSVTIRTYIPAISSGSSSTPCITSTIVRTETTPGWTAMVKKPGGCDKPIEVQFENATTRQRADFSFLYIFGKTRIDFGAVR